MKKILVLVVAVMTGNVLASRIAVSSEIGLRPVGAVSSSASPEEVPPAAKPNVAAVFGQVPLHFEANRGQTDKHVDFLSRGRGYMFSLTASEAALSLRPARQNLGTRPDGAGNGLPELASSSIDKDKPPAVLRWHLAGADPNAHGEAMEELPGKVNYFIGKDPSAWRTNIPTYAKVRYRNIYPGIDLIYYGNQRSIEYDFVLTPGADPRTIRLTFDGRGETRLESTRIDKNGDLVLRTGRSDVRLQKPVLYQEVDGVRLPVAGGYTLMKGETAGSSQVGFQVAAYDVTRPLIIDPLMDYSTYLGGLGDDGSRGIGMDENKNIYVTGTTSNAGNFPGPGGFATKAEPSNPGGALDSFIVKLDKDGVLKYSTYFGGNSNDTVSGIAVSPAGRVHVVGYTNSANFPTTMLAYNKTFNKGAPGGQDAFVLTLDTAGTLQYATFLGGSRDDLAFGVSVNSQNDSIIYVAGTTYSSDFGSKNAFQATLADLTNDGTARDAFVASLDISQMIVNDQLLFASYMGGSGSDDGFAIAGSAFVTGQTCSSNLHNQATPAPVANTAKGGCDAFMAQVSYPVNGKAWLTYFTYLGGTKWDMGRSISQVGYSELVITGETASTDFSPTNDAYQAAHGDNGTYDVFVTKLSTSGSIVYSTYLGGSGDDYGYAVAADVSGAFYVTGQSCPPYSPQPGDKPFPQVNALAPNLITHQNDNTACDAFVTKLGPPPLALAYSTYLGGAGADIGNGIVVDSLGIAYVTGKTASTNFPTAAPIQQNSGGSGDAFLARFGTGCTPGLGPFAYTGDGSIIDTENDCLLTDKWPGTTAGDTYSQQNAVVVGPDGTKVYGLERFEFKVKPSNVLIYDTATKTTTKVPAGPSEQTQGLNGVTVTPDGTRLFMPSHEEIEGPPYTHVYVMDTATNAVTAIDYGLGGGNAERPDGIAMHPDGTRVYLPNLEVHTARVIDTQTKAIDPTVISLGDAQATTALVTPDGKWAYIGNKNDKPISVIDADKANVNSYNTIVKTVGTGGSSLSATPDSKFVYASGNQVIDTANYNVTTIAGVSGGAFAVTPDGKKLYVVGNSYVTVVDATTNKMAKIILGAGGNAVAIGPQDRDGDGIIDQIDVAKVSSNDFVNPADNTQSGTIKDRANLKVTVWPAFPKGFYARASGVSGQAWINACNTDVYLPANSEAKLVCGSLTLTAIQGSAKVGLGPGRFLSVTTGGMVKVTDASGGQFLVNNLGSTTVTIVDSVGQVLGSIAAGQSSTTAAGLQVVCSPPGPVTYDRQPHPVTCTLSTSANVSISGSWSYSYTPGGSSAPVNAGTYGVTASFTSGDPNYANTTATVTLTINKAPLTVTAANASKVQGAPNPAFTVTYSGFVPGEGPQVLTGTLTLVTSATASSPAGTYPITPAGLTSTNYAITFVNGTLGVNAPGVASFAIPNLGGSSQVTDGVGAVTTAGYARIQPASGSTTPSGMAIYGYRPANILVSEAAVPATAALTSGRIYAEVGGAVNTGIAIANPNNSAVTINFYYTDTAGTDLGSGSFTLQANRQVAQFLDSSPFNTFGTTIQGTFSFTSSMPVAVVAIRGLLNERSDFVITTLPVSDTTAAPANGTVVVPRFTDGGGWTTQIILVNPTDTAMTGTVEFRNESGAVANVTIAGQTASSFPYSVSKRASQKLLTSGAGAVAVSGSVRILPAGNGAVPIPLVVFSYKPAGITVTEAGVPARSGTSLRAYVESSGTALQSGNIQTGIAATNNGSTTANVTFELFNLDGSPSGLTPVTIPLAPFAHIGRFLTEIFQNQTVPNPFKGIVRISTNSSSGISVVGLRGRYNERQPNPDFLITTTPPSIESTTPTANELFFPQLANAGGYTTQFVLFSGATGQSSSGTLRLFTQTGLPWELPVP